MSAKGYQSQLLKNAEDLVIYSDSLLRFDVIPSDKDGLKKIVDNSWSSLTSLVNKGPFFGILPTLLKKKEVVSQVIYDEVFENVLIFKDLKQIWLPKRLF